MSFFEKFLGKKSSGEGEVKYEAPIAETVAADLKTPEEWSLELERLAIDNVVLASQRQALQEQSELTPEEQEFIKPVVEETEVLGGFLVKTKEKVEKLAKNKIALAVGVIGVTLMAGRDAHAGSSANWQELIRAGTSIINQGIQENSRIAQEKERTVREAIQKQREIDAEEVRRQRDVELQKERTAETFGREQIREKRDVSVEAIRSKEGKAISYQRGGETIKVDINQAQAEADRLNAENRRMQAEIANLQLKLQKQELEKKIQGVGK